MSDPLREGGRRPGVNVFVSSGDNGAVTRARVRPEGLPPDRRQPVGRPIDGQRRWHVPRTRAGRPYVDEAAWEWPLENSGYRWRPQPARCRDRGGRRGPASTTSIRTASGKSPTCPPPATPIGAGTSSSTAKGDRRRHDASSPFWAGITSLFEQMTEEAGLPGLGYLNPTFYALSRGQPTEHGVPRRRPRRNLLYPATPGWDYATGLGSPIATRLGDTIVAYVGGSCP